MGNIGRIYKRNPGYFKIQVEQIQQKKKYITRPEKYQGRS